MRIEIEDVNFKKTVAWDAYNQHFCTVSFMGRLVRWIPGVASALDRKIKRAIQIKLQDQTITPVDKKRWLACAKKFEKGNKTLGRKEKDAFSRFVYTSVLKSLVVVGDANVLDNHPDFQRFMRENHLDKKLISQRHGIGIRNNEPHLLYEGQWTPWSILQAQLRLNPNRKDGLDLEARGFAYLGEARADNRVIFPGGIVSYNIEQWDPNVIPGKKMPRPHRQLSEEEIAELRGQGIQLPYIENFADCQAVQLPAKALKNDDHCYKKMVDVNGWVYYFGFSPKHHKSFIDEISNALSMHVGIIESPDHYVDVPPAVRESMVISCPIGQNLDEFKDYFNKVFEFIVRLHENGITYNAMENNCIEMMVYADRQNGVINGPTAQEIKVPFYQLFPKPLQFVYNWAPIPRIGKRWLLRAALDILGFNKGVTIAGFKMNAKAEFPLKKDLEVPHPRCYLWWMRAVKAENARMAAQQAAQVAQVAH